MKTERTVGEWTKVTGLSYATCRKIFIAAGVNFNRNPHNPVKLGVEEFRAAAKTINLTASRRKVRLTVCGMFFDYLTKIVVKKYESVNAFFEKTGFDRSRWYALAYGNSTKMTEKEAEIIKDLLEHKTADGC